MTSENLADNYYSSIIYMEKPARQVNELSLDVILNETLFSRKASLISYYSKYLVMIFAR